MPGPVSAPPFDFGPQPDAFAVAPNYLSWLRVHKTAVKTPASPAKSPVSLAFQTDPPSLEKGCQDLGFGILFQDLATPAKMLRGLAGTFCFLRSQVFKRRAR